MLVCAFDNQSLYAQSAQARSKKKNASDGRPKDYRSKNFLVHTDLPKEEATELLERLETMLGIISSYWGVPNRKLIECYVVKDLANWPKGKIDARALPLIQGGAGVTLSHTRFRGNTIIAANATVYAVSTRGTPQHEAVHAYCAQNFGRTGPVWYSEGMAEMGQYWQKSPKRGQPIPVNCHEWIVKYLRNTEPKSLNSIINSDEQTGDSWQNYAWRWALCHLLATNPNYSDRFRPLGLGLLTKTPASFEKSYGNMAKEISFEYLFFLKHLEKDYRVDLCSWDWKARFRKPRGKTPIVSKINAQQGWQASRLQVEEGKKYRFSTKGDWKIEKEGSQLSADGNEESTGKLVGILFHTSEEDGEYKLGEEFELGAAGTFTAKTNGKLFLRCKDDWNKLADNKGKISVKFRIEK